MNPVSYGASMCQVSFCFPGGTEVKNPPAGIGGLGFNIWAGTIPWRRKCQSTPVFLPGESHGQRSLVSYSPGGCQESATAELLSTNSAVSKAFSALSPYLLSN